MTVLDGKDAFVIDTLTERWYNNSKIFATVDIPYGYKVSDDVAKNRIKGLKTLVELLMRFLIKMVKVNLMNGKLIRKISLM